MAFTKKIRNERDLLVHFGFEVTISYQADAREIIGIAGNKNEGNFFMHVFDQWEQSREERLEQYQSRLQEVKATYPIEKDFLIGHRSMNKVQMDDIICNASFISAMVSVVDPPNYYDYLGPLAAHLHEKQLPQSSLSEALPFVKSERPNPKQELKGCPFLQFDFWGRQFRFLLPQFQYFYIAREFNQFGQALYKGKFQQSLVPVWSYIDYSKAPLKLLEINRLLKAVEVRKQQYGTKGYYEEGAHLRDAQQNLFNEWVVRHWPDYSAVRLTEIAAEIEDLLLRFSKC